jgi:hypothetical protein
LALVFAPTVARAADEADDDPYYTGFFNAYVFYLNQANLSIGILGDAVAKEAYDGKQGAAIAGVHVAWATMVQEQMAKVVKHDDTDAEDAAMIKKLSKIAGYIKDQATAIKGLAEGDSAQGAEFGKAREKAKKALDTLEEELKEHLSE